MDCWCKVESSGGTGNQEAEVVTVEEGKGECRWTVVDRGGGAREISRHGRIHRRLARAARLSSSGARNR